MKKKSLLKDSLTSRLLKYSAAAGAIIAISSNADAQVAHSGAQNIAVTPGDGGMSNVDLDGDGTDDFVFGIAGSSTYFNSVTSSNSAFIFNANTAATNSWVGATIASVLSTSYLIGASNSFTSSGPWWDLGYYGSVWGTGGSFVGAGDQYMGVKFDISGETHYGWIQINIDATCANLTIVDWAYQETPGTGLLAGSTADEIAPTVALTSVDDVVNGDFDITITFSERISGLEEGEITVTNGTLQTGTLATTDDGLTYTATITPESVGDVIIAIPADVAADASGNGNEAATNLVVEYAYGTAIDNIADQKGITAYPNPTTGLMTLDLTKSELNVNAISITDLSGRVILNQDVTKEIVKLDLSKYNKGMYILIMKTDSKQITKKIVIK